MSLGALLHLVRRPLPPLSLSPARPPEGLHGLEITPPLHVVVLWSFRILSNTIYFCNLSWIRDSGGHRDHRMCAITRRCCSCGTRVIAPRSSMTLRSAMSASSSTPVQGHNPRVRSSRVCRRTSVFRYNITNR
jgi:hypothetical protein